MVATALPATARTQVHWDRLAQRSTMIRRAKSTALYGILIAVSVPILLPYIWLATIAFSADRSIVESEVLWQSVFILVPALIAYWLWAMAAPNIRQLLVGFAVISVIAGGIFAVVVLPELHLRNFIFLVDRNFNNTIRELEGRPVTGSYDLPSVWLAFRNSLILAGSQTAIVAVVACLSAYYLSRFKFPGRAGMLRSLLVLHAFPVLTLIVPLFLMLNFFGLLNKLLGVILVLVAFELPFAIFIMKGFFDGVPWEIEMSALADGASRRQAFVKVVLPQVTNGIIAISVFSFIRGWEEYIFVFTFIFQGSSSWTMSLYMFFVRDDIMGVDFGVVSAVGVFYLAPSLVLYTVAQRYLAQMTVGGVKG